MPGEAGGMSVLAAASLIVTQTNCQLFDDGGNDKRIESTGIPALPKGSQGVPSPKENPPGTAMIW